ncbi:ImmA/IrrE family metallo-endopeptidase [Bacillus sp. SIMBA_161]|uniref:ImmA/IrrE family metallo-endopeptidase n=2 Tax=Bacillati TaxID=1783272 RepID=UPI003979BB44
MIFIYTTKNIKHKAESVIESFKTNDIYEICKKLKIIITKSNLGRVRGFLQFYEEENHYLIHVNEKFNYEKLVIAHELGHFFLHKNVNTFKLANCSSVLENKLEHQADVFASEILLTDEMLTNALPEIENMTHIQIASFFQLPLFVIEYKVEQLRLLSRTREYSIPRHFYQYA